MSDPVIVDEFFPGQEKLAAEALRRLRLANPRTVYTTRTSGQRYFILAAK